METKKLNILKTFVNNNPDLVVEALEEYLDLLIDDNDDDGSWEQPIGTLTKFMEEFNT